MSCSRCSLLEKTTTEHDIGSEEWDHLSSNVTLPTLQRSRQWIGTIVAWLLAAVLGSCMTYLLSSRRPSEVNCSRPGSIQHDTPWMNIDRSLHVYRFLPFNTTPTRYSADASIVGNDVDDAWKELGIYYKSIIVPEKHASAYNIIPNKHDFKTPESDPRVPYPGYLVNVEVYHHLHCLNFIRQGLYHNYEFYRSDPSNFGWDDEPNLVKGHIAHCVDQLRQLIMCYADADLVPYHEPESDHEAPLPDFEREKQCRNFESLRAWAEKMQWEGAFDETPRHNSQKVGDSVLS